MSYNFLKEARSIRNSFLCKYDTLDGYSSNFVTNGDVDGWDVYNNIYMYGCWGGVLFGTSYDRDCYISRLSVFLSIAAEDYYIVKILMKLTNNNTNKIVNGFTTGRLQWTYIGDTSWDEDKQMDFDLISDDSWHLYEINVGPKQYWQGDINNLRIYPFIDGWAGDQFAIKYIKISSISNYACRNTQCDKYLLYSHPCPWTGDRGSCEAGISRESYTTISGINDKLIINIDGYGEEKFDLGTNLNLSPVDMARIISNKISSVNIGGYNYAEVIYSENDKLEIYSGNVGENSSIEIIDNVCARELGFFDEDTGEDISTYTAGVESASGFDYASSRMLTSAEINKLMDGDINSPAYIHEPSEYSVEGGRRDFNAVGTPYLISSLSDPLDSDYDSFDNTGKTIIDLSHPINNNGRINNIYVYGKISALSKIKILRPYRDGTMKVLYSVDLPIESSSYIYTSLPLNYRVDCDLLVSKGDLIGAYNIDLYVGTSLKGLPDAIFYQITGDPSVGDVVEGDKIYSYGITGFAIYAKSERLQNNIILDIDFGDRVNVEELNIYGREESSYFEYNIAACLDVSWSVNLYGGSHFHTGYSAITLFGWYKAHTNVAYGVECLDDCIVTADNGQIGTGYYVDSDIGLVTTGDDHSYFYVNGDAEWLYNKTCDNKYEFCGNTVAESTGGFVTDPISFTLYFPYGYTTSVHKSIVYFKEKDNFRKIELAYYVGSFYEGGNATYDTTMVRIPEYTSIKLNGLEYLPNDGSDINEYIFSNPTNDDPIYTTYGQSDPSNPDEYMAAMLADWTILEHNFDPVECKGFRIFTNKHRSTKIMEMEVYSRMYHEASLVDNVSLSFSDDNEVWATASFYESGDNSINAFIGGAPRYMHLELESSTTFDLNELECLVGDQVKLPNCEDVVYLAESKSNIVSAATPITLENVYGAPFDLMVDIPVETSSIENLVFWNKLNSESDVDDPQIGPGCRLYKSEDYYISNSNYICSVNTPAYGLKNMIHDKQAYINHYINDLWYEEYETLLSGTSVDYSNNDRKDLKYSIIEFNDPSNTYKYWKIGFNTISGTFYVNDILPYTNDEKIDIEFVYQSGFVGSGTMSSGVASNGFDLPTHYYVSNDAIGFRLVDHDGLVNKIKIFHSSSILSQISLYGSNDNITYTLSDNDGTISINNENWYEYFSIDLEKRHNLAIMRNYGNADGKLDIGISNNVDFSSSDTDDVNAVDWNNSTYTDARWARIKILCGDGVTRYIRKIGIYPDISTAYCLGSSGYNCEWQLLDTILADYYSPVNIAYGATVTGTSDYIRNYYADNAVDGISTNYTFDSCWGIGSAGGYLELDFGDAYYISKVVLYHGYNPDDSDFINTAYSFKVSTSVSGSDFTTVFSTSGNSTADRTHNFEPVYARRARFTITAYDANRLYFTDSDGVRTSIYPAFLREIEVYTYVDEGYVDSESWPVVAMNLLDSFNVTGHELINIETESEDTDWDNSDEYFMYSDSVYSDPHKVIFNRAGDVIYAYSTTDDTGDLKYSTEYIFDEDVYVDVGVYSVSWQAYDPTTEDEISLHFIGPETITLNATNLATSTYADQSGTITITTAGLYTVKVTQNESYENSWGARNIYVYRNAGFSRWVSVTRNTATNYSFDDDSDNYGIDYLSQLKIYGDAEYKPTEYYQWWQSTESSLSNDGFVVMTGQKSLKIEYPMSSGIDTLQIMEAGAFNEDLYFSSKDFLHFYLYVDDINALDTVYGDVTFGSLNEMPIFYYMWTLSGINFVAGWNDINLKFEEADSTYPYTIVESMYNRLNPLLNFRTNDRDVKSFRMRYRGIGTSFVMYMDDLKVVRNRFDDFVKFNNGLCLIGSDCLEIPSSNLNFRYGSIEFYVKLYTDTYGVGIFGDMYSRVLFTLINNNNDLISLGIKSGYWFVPNTGNARSSLNTFESTLNLIPSEFMYERDDVVHIGFVWSNDGTHMDNNDTIRLYLDGKLACYGTTTWDIGDTKFAMLKFGGPNTQLIYNGDIDGSAIFSNIKIYDYCKTNFNINDVGMSSDVVYTPNKFLEISSDNINFYGVGSENLPVTFLQVPNGESRTVYIRSNKDENFSGSNSTASLVVEWLTTV